MLQLAADLPTSASYQPCSVPVRNYAGLELRLRPWRERVGLRVSKSDVICGVPAPIARQLMRAYVRDRPGEVAYEVLGLDHDGAQQQMHAFEAGGYVERSSRGQGPEDVWWVTTIKGNALAQASFGRPISRATAARLLSQVIERVRAYNADPSRLLTVARMEVFGSYLDPDVDRLGDLDLAVSIMRREADSKRHATLVLEYAAASGQHFGEFIDRFLWPERELLMILKNRSPAISITSEDIRTFTDRFLVVYQAEAGPEKSSGTERLTASQDRPSLAAVQPPVLWHVDFDQGGAGPPSCAGRRLAEFNR